MAIRSAEQAIVALLNLFNGAGAVVKPAPDQNPIFDHANGTKTSVTSSVTILTPPAGCEFARISTDVDCFVRTDGTDAADAAGSIKIAAGTVENIPVTAALAVKGYAASTAVIRVTPFKARG